MIATIAALPAGALGADGAAAEPPSTGTESGTPEATTPPPSTGWVPQGSGEETASGGAAPIRRGSSLGSGGAGQTAPASEESTSTGSSGVYVAPVPESPAASPLEETTSPPATETETESGASALPAAEPKADKPADVALGGGAAVIKPEPAAGAPFVPTIPAAALDDEAGSGSISAPWPLLVVLVLLVGFLAVRVGLRRWRSRQRWRREATEWKAAIRRIDPGPDFVLHEARASGSAGEQARPAEKLHAKAS